MGNPIVTVQDGTNSSAARVTELWGFVLKTPIRVLNIVDLRRAETLVDVHRATCGSAKSLVIAAAEAVGVDLGGLLTKYAGNLKITDSELLMDAQERLESAIQERTNPRPEENYKQDSGKVDYTLLMHDMAPAVRKVVECLHWGHYTKGYPRNGYKTLPGGTDRLMAACYRHMAAMADDFWASDEESGMPHAVHAVTNLLMAMSRGVDK